MIKHERALNIFKESVVKETLNDIPSGIRKSLGLHKEETIGSATETFTLLCDKAASMQQGGTLGDIVSIRFSFLRTEFAREKGIYSVDACDERPFATKIPCFALWDAKYIFDPYFEIVRLWKTKGKKCELGIREVDVDGFASEISVFPQFIANVFLAGLANTFGEHASYAVLSKTGDCTITVGEYGGLQTTVYPVNQNEKRGETL
ncbi:MAG: hypothetical protein LBK57_01440 [Clostridiales Family XIII bacterium]|jgi:hypothetical protein|nr:hypothetical protein [Clostridiales Family XIII bacterium]